MEVQSLLGSDIQMQLDECVRLPCSYEEAERAMRLSLRWAECSRSAFGQQPGRAIFGIVQGGTEKDLRLFSAQELVEMDFHGYAIGGLAVGEPQAAMLDTLDAVVPHLPFDKPRYLMGVGTPDDLLQAVTRGVDMFDCVMPTRAGRHGMVFTRRGRLNLRNARFAEDPRPVDPLSSSVMARDYSRAYWRHLTKSGEILAMMGLTEINLAYYQDLMSGARLAISEGLLDAYIAETQRNWAEGEAEGR
jgi:queuine tRNA-ribosyltransferase